MTAALLLLRRFWPIIQPILLTLAFASAIIGTAWAWGNHREAQGVAKERAAWEQEASRLRAIAATEAAQRAAAVTAANDAATRSQAGLDALAAQSRNDHATYYRNRPSVPCLSVERVRAIKEADRAASVAASAK